MIDHYEGIGRYTTLMTIVKIIVIYISIMITIYTNNDHNEGLDRLGVAVIITSGSGRLETEIYNNKQTKTLTSSVSQWYFCQIRQRLWKTVADINCREMKDNMINIIITREKRSQLSLKTIAISPCT